MLALTIPKSIGFGSTNTFSKPAFGQTPTTGSGLFGATPAATTTTGFGGGGGFGAGTTTNTGFGATNSSTGTNGAFGNKFGAATTGAGTTGGIFGTAGTTNTGFGTGNQIGFGGAAGTEVPVTGTSNPVFAATQEKDPASSSTNHFQTISFMPAYQKFSLEVSLYDNLSRLYIMYRLLIDRTGAKTTRLSTRKALR